MTVKEKLYKFIVEEKPTSLIKWQKFQSKCPQVRIKTVGSNRTILINLEEHGEWYEPNVWAGNYKASIKQRLTSEISRARNILSQEALEKVIGIQSVASSDGQPIDERQLRKEMFNKQHDALKSNVDLIIELVNEGDVRQLLDVLIQLECIGYSLSSTEADRAAQVRMMLGE